MSGAPLDHRWTVLALKRDRVMTGLASIPAKLGDCALIASAGVRVVITGIRYQAGARSDAMHEPAGCRHDAGDFLVVSASHPWLDAAHRELHALRDGQQLNSRFLYSAERRGTRAYRAVASRALTLIGSTLSSNGGCGSNCSITPGSNIKQYVEPPYWK